MELSNSASKLGPPTGFPFEPTLVDNKVNSKYPGGGERALWKPYTDSHRMRKWRWSRLSTYNIWQYLYTGYYWIPCGNLAQQCEKSPIFYGKTSIYWKTKPLEMHFRQTWPHLPRHRFSIFSYPCLVKLSIHQASSNNTMVKWQKKKKHVSVSFSKFVRRFDQPYVHTLTALVPCTRDAREA